MPMFRSLLATLALSLVMSAAPAQMRREQDQALAARRAGQVMPLREIEARVLPHMRGADYLGPEFDPASNIYRLKFMRGQSVIWLDVDARNGQIVGKSGQ